jgi:hypothetical protein
MTPTAAWRTSLLVMTESQLPHIGAPRAMDERGSQP